MLYVVYSTSNSDYQSWQCKLLEWSFKKVNQPGKLIRLCSHNSHEPNREFDTSDTSEIIRLPDYRTRWTNFTNNVDKDYGIVNKTESLKYWIKNYPNLQDSDNVFLIDPDMVFTKSVDFTTEQGTIIAQKWIDCNINSKAFQTYAPTIMDKINSESVFMYPYIITVGDLKKIINKYVDLTYKIRLENYPHLWEAEMYALIISSISCGLQIKTLDNFGVCLSWGNYSTYLNKQNVDSTYMLHCPSPILDKNKNKIFFKQDYTPFTKEKNWLRINPNTANSLIEKKFLQELDNYNADKKIKFYWNNSNLIDSLFDYQAEHKYLVFNPWPGGFNNIRMSLEIAACLAFLQNRVLVLPPKYKMYLLDNVNCLSDFFDINDLGIKTISFEDFAKKFSISNYNDIKNIGLVIDSDIVNTCLTTSKNVPDGVLKGREILNINDFINTQIVFFNKNLLGSFYLNIYTEKINELYKYVARHIHYNKEIFYEAYKIIDNLGDYYAIHIRRNDFQYKDLFISIEQIYENIKDVIPKGSKLYISTDEKDKSFFSLLKENYSVVFYDDLNNLVYSEINTDIIGPIEQIICTESKIFIGSKLSTFSSYIYRLRGYMNSIKDKRFLTYHVKCKENEEEDNWWMNVWAREYSNPWSELENINYFDKDGNLSKKISKKIFVSIASYRDPQIEDTINSLLVNQSGDNEIIIGVCLQDTEENYKKFKYINKENVKISFIPYKESKGVSFARKLIQEKLFDNEDYFLQIDSHTRSCKNWDKILIEQLKKCPNEKSILSTYPNAFDPHDKEENYFKKNTCPYLKISFIDHLSKIHPTSAGVVPKDALIHGFWVAAGFLFTTGEWCKEVIYNSDFYFTGEEDYLSVISYVKGYDVYTPDISTIWHDYTDTRIQSPKKYRPLHWEDHGNVENDGTQLLKNLYENGLGVSGKRTAPEFLQFAKNISSYVEDIEIEMEFNFNKIPLPDPNKKIKVIIFAFKDLNEKEIFRPDICDESIFNRTTNKIKLKIDKNIHRNAVKVIWFYKYDDDTFSQFLQFPIIKEQNLYRI